MGLMNLAELDRVCIAIWGLEANKHGLTVQASGCLRAGAKGLDVFERFLDPARLAGDKNEAQGFWVERDDIGFPMGVGTQGLHTPEHIGVGAALLKPAEGFELQPAPFEQLQGVAQVAKDGAGIRSGWGIGEEESTGEVVTKNPGFCRSFGIAFRSFASRIGQGMLECSPKHMRINSWFSDR